jgi:hypothetical protein
MHPCRDPQTHAGRIEPINILYSRANSEAFDFFLVLGMYG